MGQNLFEPPDVNGWDAGKGWFSTGSMLARMNFASTLTTNQRSGCWSGRGRTASTPETLVAWVLESIRTAPVGAGRRSGARELPARDRSVDGVQRAAPGEGARPRPPGGRHTGVPIRMKVTRREFVKGGVAAFTVTFGAPAFISELGPGAGRPRQEPGHPVSGRRQRRAQHARAVQRPRVLRPPAVDCDPGGQRAAGGRRSVERGARPASAAHGPASDLQPGAPRAHPAHGVPEPEPLALPGHATSGRRRTPRTLRASAGSAAISTRCLRRSIRSSAGTRRATCRACCCRTTCRCRRFRARRPTRSTARTPGAEAAAERNAAVRISSHVPVDRPGAGVRLRQPDGRPWPRSIVWRRWHLRTHASRIPNTGFGQAMRAVAGAMVRGIGTRVYYVTTGGFDTHAGQNPNASTAPTTT